MIQRDYSKMLEADVLVNYIVARYNKGFYSLTLTSGLPGTGKSSVDIRFAELISIALTGENKITSANVMGSFLDLVEFVQQANEKEVNIAVIEEISVLFPSRRAMAADNVAVQKVLDTCRKKRVILIANAPLWPSVDSHLRALGNIYLETLRINKEHQVVICKAFRLQTNPGSGKTYFHCFRRRGKRIQRMIFRKPNPETWKEYEEAKDKFMSTLYEKLKMKAKATEEKELIAMGMKPKEKIIRPLTPKELRIYDMSFRKNMTQKEISFEMGTSISNISQIIKRIKNKIDISLDNKGFNVKKDTTEGIK